VRATGSVRALLLLPAQEQELLPLGGGLLAAVLHELTGGRLGRCLSKRSRP
jgi:hypothetical protein